MLRCFLPAVAVPDHCQYVRSLVESRCCPTFAFVYAVSGRRRSTKQYRVTGRLLPAAAAGLAAGFASAGFWPGGGGVEYPAFYAYAYPEPAGFADAAVRPDQAYYHPDLHEFILPYDAVRTAPDPDEALLAFLQSTYEAAATLGAWDRSALECPLGTPSVPRRINVPLPSPPE